MDPNCRWYGHDYGRDWDDKPTRCLRCGALHPTLDYEAAIKRIIDERLALRRRGRQRAASTGDEP